MCHQFTLIHTHTVSHISGSHTGCVSGSYAGCASARKLYAGCVSFTGFVQSLCTGCFMIKHWSSHVCMQIFFHVHTQIVFNLGTQVVPSAYAQSVSLFKRKLFNVLTQADLKFLDRLGLVFLFCPNSLLQSVMIKIIMHNYV